MKSWKTTALGILILIVALGSAGVAILDGDPNTTIDFKEIMAALAGIGLTFARDNDKSSEDVGVKK